MFMSYYNIHFESCQHNYWKININPEYYFTISSFYRYQTQIQQKKNLSFHGFSLHLTSIRNQPIQILWIKTIPSSNPSRTIQVATDFRLQTLFCGKQAFKNFKMIITIASSPTQLPVCIILMVRIWLSAIHWNATCWIFPIRNKYYATLLVREEVIKTLLI